MMFSEVIQTYKCRSLTPFTAFIKALEPNDYYLFTPSAFSSADTYIYIYIYIYIY